MLYWWEVCVKIWRIWISNRIKKSWKTVKDFIRMSWSGIHECAYRLGINKSWSNKLDAILRRKTKLKGQSLSKRISHLQRKRKQML